MNKLSLHESENDPRKARKYFKSAFEKKLIALSRRRNAVWKEIRNLPMIELEEPYQRGYKRYFVLRTDIAIGDKAEFFQNILDKINTEQIHHDDKFQVRQKRKRKRVGVDKPQFLKRISQYDWAKNPKFAFNDKEKVFFELRDVYYPLSRVIRQEYVFTQQWRFVLKIVPNIITHVRQLDADLEKEQKYITNYLERRNLDCKINKLFGRKNSYKDYNRAWDVTTRTRKEHAKAKTERGNE